MFLKQTKNGLSVGAHAVCMFCWERGGAAGSTTDAQQLPGRKPVLVALLLLSNKECKRAGSPSYLIFSSGQKQVLGSSGQKQEVPVDECLCFKSSCWLISAPTWWEMVDTRCGTSATIPARSTEKPSSLIATARSSLMERCNATVTPPQPGQAINQRDFRRPWGHGAESLAERVR